MDMIFTRLQITFQNNSARFLTPKKILTFFLLGDSIFFYFWRRYKSTHTQLLNMNKLITKLQKSLAAFLVFGFALVSTTITYAADAPSGGNVADGQKLFKANCAVCHSIG